MCARRHRKRPTQTRLRGCKPRCEAAGQAHCRRCARSRRATGKLTVESAHPKEDFLRAVERSTRSTSPPATSSRPSSRSALKSSPASIPSPSTALCASSILRPTCISCAWMSTALQWKENGTKQSPRRSTSSARRPSCWCASRAPGRVPPHRRHASRARQTKKRTAHRARSCCSDEKERRRTRDAGRPRPQRRRPRQRIRHRQVQDLMIVERYSHVMHLVSSLEGQPAPELSRRRRLPRLLPRRHLSAARPRSAPWRSSRSSSPPAAASTAAASSTPTSPAISTPASPSAPCCMKGEQGYIQAGAGIVADSDSRKRV